jgi:hypothetical protein
MFLRRTRPDLKHAKNAPPLPLLGTGWGREAPRPRSDSPAMVNATPPRNASGKVPYTCHTHARQSADRSLSANPLN